MSVDVLRNVAGFHVRFGSRVMSRYVYTFFVCINSNLKIVVVKYFADMLHNLFNVSWRFLKRCKAVISV